jgi:hypothetical protein
MTARSRALRTAGLVAGGAVVAAAAAVAIGEIGWRRSTSRRLEQLDQCVDAESPGASRPFDPVDLASLPPPVARYLAFALPEGQRRIRVAHIQWRGAMRLQPGGPWSPFTADQRFTVRPPGFVWDARIRMLPLISVLVRDSYVAAAGQMLGRVAGVMNVVNEGGTPEMAQGALARWLGEAAWFPTAFLPGEGLTWQAVDDSTARATVTDGSVSASADFHLAATGELRSMSALRYRDVNGRGVLTQFEGVYHGFERHEGLMIPSSAEVAWLLPEGRFSYWRGKPMSVHFDLAH